MKSRIIRSSIRSGFVGFGACIAATVFAAGIALADDAVQDDGAASTTGVASPRNTAAPRSAPTGTNVITLTNSNGRRGEEGTFARLDRSHHGYLSRDDVAAESYLSANFDRCDTDRDGRLSRAETAVCLQ